MRCFGLALWLHLFVHAASSAQPPRRSPAREADPLKYQFTIRQVLAFEISLTTDYGEQWERYHGHAVAEVLTVSPAAWLK